MLQSIDGVHTVGQIASANRCDAVLVRQAIQSMVAANVCKIVSVSKTLIFMSEDDDDEVARSYENQICLLVHIDRWSLA